MFSTGEVGAAIDAAAEAKVEVEEEEDDEDEDGGAPSSKGLGEGEEEDMVGIEELLRGRREGRKKKK